VIDGLALVEAGHFNGIFHRCATPVDAQGSVVVPGDRDDASINLRRELAVDPDFFVTGGFPLLQCRIVQEGKADGALDLERAAAFKKDRCRVRIDPLRLRMRHWIS
jgi:hypothetical protein